MSIKQKRIFWVLLGLAVVYFGILMFPNATGAADRNMLAVFEPDEFAQYPHVIRMLTGGSTFKETLGKFFAYQHYYYGFPFYLSSAISIFPIKLITGNLENTQLIMLVLRQMVSVLPMLLAVLTLVYVQTRFRSYFVSIFLFVFLLTIPAVVRNDLWWHPDSLAILFAVLVFFFLDRDNFEYGNNFYFAAIACGLASGTKLIGFFFFISIPVYILWGLSKKQLTIRLAFYRALLFVLIMFSVIVISNPMLLSSSGRTAIFNIQRKQSVAMSFGWDVAYAKGPASWANILVEYYGLWLLWGLSLTAILFGILRDKKRLLHVMILTWAVPFSVYILFFVAIKPKHLFLPIALPVFSSLALYLFFVENQFKEGLNFTVIKKRKFNWAIVVLVLGIIAVQFTNNLVWSVEHYLEKLYRVRDSASISFYQQLVDQEFGKIPDQIPIKVYRDIRIYVPDDLSWDIDMKWNLVDYNFIQENEYDIVLLSRQRMLDYTHPNSLQNAEDLAQMTRTYQFYSDASIGSLNGYTLLYEDGYGLAFISNDLYERFFSIQP